MKRCLVSLEFFVCLLMAHSIGFGQMPIRIGFAGGMNFAKQSFSPLPLYASANGERIGVILGGVAEIKIADYFFIQAEPRYTQKGVIWPGVERRDEANNYLGINDIVETMGYLEIPVLVKVQFVHTEFKPSFFAGPNIGILLSANSRWGTESPYDLKSKYAGIDASMDFGFGAEY